MKIIFTYVPIRLNDLTEMYIEFSVKNLNHLGIKPKIFSDKNYFKHKKLEYEWIEIKVEPHFLINNMWSYPKLKTLSLIDEPFIHFDNDLLINNLETLNRKLCPQELNLCYRHDINFSKKIYYEDIIKRYKDNKIINISYLNNTSIIGTQDYRSINKTYQNVLETIEDNLDFFKEKHNEIPPITLNQQYLNNFFDKINYIFESNPNYSDFELNGICHLDNKILVKELINHKSII